MANHCVIQFARPGLVQKVALISDLNSTSVEIRYWVVDPSTARARPVQLSAAYCQTHAICYLARDFPQGCPRCNPGRIV